MCLHGVRITTKQTQVQFQMRDHILLTSSVSCKNPHWGHTCSCSLNYSVWHSAQVYWLVLRFRLLFWQAGHIEHICGVHGSHNQVFNCSTSVGKALLSNATMGSLQSLRSRCGCRHTSQVWQSGAVHLGRQHSLHKVRRSAVVLCLHIAAGSSDRGFTYPQRSHLCVGSPSQSLHRVRRLLLSL